jgi:hypothetical protein
MPNVSTWEHLQSGALFDARPRLYRTVIELAGQASGTEIDLGEIPAGRYFVAGVLLGDTSLGSATLAIGTPDEATKFRSASTFTSVDTPTLFGKTAAALTATKATLGRAGVRIHEPSVNERVIATVGSASLPSSGTVLVTLVYSGT